MSNITIDVVKNAIVEQIDEDYDWELIGIAFCDAGCCINSSAEEDYLFYDALKELIAEGRVEVNGDINDYNKSYVRLRTEKEFNAWKLLNNLQTELQKNNQEKKKELKI